MDEAPATPVPRGTINQKRARQAVVNVRPGRLGDGMAQLARRHARNVPRAHTKTTADEAPAIRALKETINQRRERQAALNVRPERMEGRKARLVGRRARSVRVAHTSLTADEALAIRALKETINQRRE